MNKEEEGTPKLRDEIRGQFKKNKHHLIKMFIAIIAIPVTTLLLESMVFGGANMIYLSVLMSSWATYLLISIYDGVVTRETQRAKTQIIKNTLDIIVIEEDVKALQREVYKGRKKDIRIDNYTNAMRRKGEAYMKGDFDGRSSKD